MLTIESQWDLKSVKVNNLIQLWRKLLCNFSDLEPQQARKDQGSIPQKFIINNENNINPHSILEIIKDNIILIPCDEGEEKDFIQQDELLHHLLVEQVEPEIPWNILSAITAKGLEFKQVILYKFGQRCPENLWQKQLESTEEVKYFLNKLYVAASRPTEKLFIIDCPNGEAKLWHNLNNQDLLAEKLSQIKDYEQRDKWQSNIQIISPGTSFEYMKNDNLEANALSFATVGINTENPEFLKRAIVAYRKCNNLHQANFCSAWVLRLERKFIVAGNLFLQLNYIPEAAECFWQGLDWSKLRHVLLEKTSTIKLNSRLNRLHLLFPLVDFMATISEANDNLKIKEITQQIIVLRDFLLVESAEKIFTEEYHTQSWQTVLTFYQQVISQISHKSDIFVAAEWLKFKDSLACWFEKNNFEINLLIAKCWYLGQDYHQAIKVWENLGEPTQIIPAEDLTYYYLAKAKVATLPAGLEYLAIAKQYHIIINQWVQNGKSLEASWLKYVAIAFAETNNLEQALTISCYLDDLTTVQKYWQQLLQDSNSFPLKYLHRIVQYYLEKEHWQEAINLVEKNITIREFKYYFVYRLALSKLTPEKLDFPQRQLYQNFLASNILNNIQWQKYFSLYLIGVVLEKIGSLNYTLAFYEQYTNSNKEKLRNFSRQRWLVTKQRQIEYFQTANNRTKVQKNQTEFALQANNWNLTTQSISLKIPEITRKKTKLLPRFDHFNNFHLPSRKSLSSFSADVNIKGLEEKNLVKPIAYGVRQFQLHHLVVRIIVFTKQITIINLLDNQTIYCDCKYGTLQTGTTTIYTSGTQPLSFRESQGKYYGRLWNQPVPRLELNFETYSQKITIEFDNL